MLATVRVTSVYARHGSPWVGSPRGPVRYMFSTVVGSKGTTLALAYGNLIGCMQREEVTGHEVAGEMDQDSALLGESGIGLANY
jgi:hypothetical protein